MSRSRIEEQSLIFMDYDLNLPSKNMKKQKNKNIDKLVSDELLESYEKGFGDVDAPDRLDAISYISALLCNKMYKEVPSEFYPDKVYDVKIIQFLKENGKILYRKIYDNNVSKEIEMHYLFMYNGYFIGGTFASTTTYPEGMVSNLSIIHPIHIKIDMDVFSKFEKHKAETPKIGIIKTTKFGPTVSWNDHKTDLKFNESHYNDDFPEFFSDLKTKLTENKTGLYLFYGEAGTGKSSAIRHLIVEIDRPVVFIPPQMINCLSNPDFTDLVLNSLNGSVLVIEDAEKALMKRESADAFHNSELVSSLLNLTDGLYADLANTSIIATYNCDRNLIDPALLRKGRLRSEYHFQKLSIDRSNKLMNTLNHEFDVIEPMTLADIFNHEKQYTNKKTEKKRSVGFGEN